MSETKRGQSWLRSLPRSAKAFLAFVLVGGLVGWAQLGYDVYHGYAEDKRQADAARPALEVTCRRAPPVSGEDDYPDHQLSYLHADVFDERDLGYNPYAWGKPRRSRDDLLCAMRSITGQPLVKVTVFFKLYFTSADGERELGPFPLQFDANVPAGGAEQRYANMGRAWIRLDFQDDYVRTLPDGTTVEEKLANSSLPTYYLEPAQPTSQHLRVHSLLTCYSQGWSSYFWRPTPKAIFDQGDFAFVNLPDECKKPPKYTMDLPEIQIDSR